MEAAVVDAGDGDFRVKGVSSVTRCGCPRGLARIPIHATDQLATDPLATVPLATVLPFAGLARALGLQQLKRLKVCMGYNKRVPAANRVNPRPGGPNKLLPGTKVPPYISSEPDVTEVALAVGETVI